MHTAILFKLFQYKKNREKSFKRIFTAFPVLLNITRILLITHFKFPINEVLYK